jgi:ribonuclease HI
VVEAVAVEVVAAVAEDDGNVTGVVTVETTKHTFTVDASYNRPANTVGIGILVQATDRPRKRGRILSQHSEAYRGVSASCMEEFAIFRALEIASELSCQFVKVRSDCNSVRTRLKKDHKEDRGRKSASLHGTILRLAKQFAEVKFAYVPRRKNHIAHSLARKAARELTPQANPLLAAHDSET